METIVNRVAESGIMTLDLSDYLPDESAVIGFDLKPFLFRELMLKEKDYRAALQGFDWSPFQGKDVYITCSADAIIPTWAYMLAAAYLQPLSRSVHFGSREAVREQLLLSAVNGIDIEAYRDKRVVIKGCGDMDLPPSAYVAITTLLRPVVRSLMYGEPCSTVPVFKRK